MSDCCNTDVLIQASDLVERRIAFVMATVVETEGSTSARLGAKALFDKDGTEIMGWVGGGCAESTVAHAAVEVAETRRPRVTNIDMHSEVLGVGMPCGGAMKVLVEPIIPKPRLWITGHGRIAESLCRMGFMVGLSVIIDDALAEQSAFADAERIVADNMDYDALRPDAEDFVVIATQHRGDHQSLQRVLKSEARYIGLIASGHRAALTLGYLREAGVGEESLQRIQTPAGLRLGAQSPAEIALEVISEIVLIRRQGDNSQRASRGELLDHRAISARLPPEL